MSEKTPQQTQWHAFADTATLQHTVLERLQQHAQEAILQRGRFDLVLAGGTTPQAIYRECRHITTDWSCWHLYFGDERCLPPDHPERNSRMALDAWLAHVPIPANQIHAIPAELGATAAAQAYGDTLPTVGDFDFVLLGLGEDGHTASLFPGHSWGDTEGSPDVLAVFDAPKPPPERVSLSARRLSRARKVAFVVTGQGKRDAVAAWRAGQQIPAHSISPGNAVDIFFEASLLA